MVALFGGRRGSVEELVYVYVAEEMDLVAV
jgi:hypothetical protein